jgi:tRNA A37 methylthiotransferase MiaB
MVGETHEVLAVEPGTGDSVKCRDEAYRQVIVTNAGDRGVEIGYLFEVEVTSHEAMYCFGEPV